MVNAACCSIDGCEKPRKSRGMCGKHYMRWITHGDASTIMIVERGEPTRFYREVVLTDELGPDDECLIWPFHKSADGYARLNGDDLPTHYVSRLVCLEVHGEPPTSDHEAAHRCGKGQFGCVTKSHLRWATPTENKADELIHGTRARGEKAPRVTLTEEQVRYIRNLKGKMPREKLAAEVGVTPPTITRIWTGSRWGWLQ